MALIHDFLLIPATVSEQISRYQEIYIAGGKIEHFPNFEAVPKPIDRSADKAVGNMLMDFFLENRPHALGVQDKYLLKHLLEFNVVETYFTGFIPCMGLNYYGFTLIPWESLPVFIGVLRKNSIRNSYGKLICLCEEAYKTKHAVLHCGI